VLDLSLDDLVREVCDSRPAATVLDRHDNFRSADGVSVA
jgi:hypothetical protein